VAGISLTNHLFQKGDTMVEILVKPAELTNTASELRAHAKRLQAAIDAVDADMRALGPGSFEGARADALRSRYSQIRVKIYQFKPLIEHFAKDLDEASARFAAADKS
jgi:WXG100 family type VII secretion target